MNYEELKKDNLIISYEAPKEQIEKELKLAERDLKVAKNTLDEDNDWAFSIAYNAILQAGRALMFSNGYRPRGITQHKTVLRFIELTLGKSHQEKVRFIDSMRINRHRVMYDEPELISASEAKYAIQIAEEFVKLVKNNLHSKSD
jgi:uncharacterized protein (UPF0332 family)